MFLFQQGCYFHRCPCKPENLKNATETDIEKKHKLDAKKHAYIKKLGYTLIIMRECDWKKMKEEDESIMKCVRDNMLYNYHGPGWKKNLNEKT